MGSCLFVSGSVEFSNHPAASPDELRGDPLCFNGTAKMFASPVAQHCQSNVAVLPKAAIWEAVCGREASKLLRTLMSAVELEPRTLYLESPYLFDESAT